MAAFLIALPYVLYQVWAFVAPGLYQHEKRLALPVIFSSVVFFALGMAFAYFFVFPIAFGFFAGYTPAGVQMMTDIDKYLSFVLTMFLAFGITFEVPVVVVVLVRLGSSAWTAALDRATHRRRVCRGRALHSPDVRRGDEAVAWLLNEWGSVARFSQDQREPDGGERAGEVRRPPRYMGAACE